MIRGLYTAASGMMLQQVRQDVVANNLANVDTTGFKKDLAQVQAFPTQPNYRLGEEEKDINNMDTPVPPVYIGELGTGAVIKAVSTDHSEGLLKQTGNDTDEALTESGLFFAVNTPQGLRYTRDGSFKLNSQGILVNDSGYPVWVEDAAGGYGPLQVQGGEVHLDNYGRVTVSGGGTATVNGQEAAHIAVYQANTKLMEKQGDNLYTALAQPQPVNLGASGAVMKSGYLESSNVNAVREMVNMIEVVRLYEMNQKVIQGEDQLLDTAINTVGQT